MGLRSGEHDVISTRWDGYNSALEGDCFSLSVQLERYARAKG